MKFYAYEIVSAAKVTVGVEPDQVAVTRKLYYELGEAPDCESVHAGVVEAGSASEALSRARRGAWAPDPAGSAGEAAGEPPEALTPPPRASRTAEGVVEDLCRLLNVDMDGLARAAAPGDPHRQTVLKGGEDLNSFVNVLFNADNSIANVCRLVFKAAGEPTFKVDVFRHDRDGVGHPSGRIELRAPDGAAAEVAALQRLRREAADTVTWSVKAFEVSADEANVYSGDGDGEVRRL